jgi:hypothetical protein
MTFLLESLVVGYLRSARTSSSQSNHGEEMT